jgi:hypothetical protein
VKEAEAASKRRGWKRKSPTPVRAKVKRVRKSEVVVAEDEIAVGWMREYCSSSP